MSHSNPEDPASSTPPGRSSQAERVGARPAPNPHPEPGKRNALTIIRNYAREHSLRDLLTIAAEQYIGLLLRWIPSFEGIFLRNWFYRTLFKRLDGFAFIYQGAYLDHSQNISAGHSLAINTGAFISARAPLTFGDGVLIGPNVVIVTSNHRYDLDDRPINEQGHDPKPIHIGSDCWIGANAVIVPGVHVADGTIVSAGAVVTRDTEPYSIVAGVPARRIGARGGHDAESGANTASEAH
jgi:maltose O-acetyltransferase